MKNVLTLNSFVSHRFQSLAIKSAIMQGAKLHLFYTSGLYLLALKNPANKIVFKTKLDMEANTMFLATIISIRSESNVLTNCRKTFSARAMSLSAEVNAL